MLKFFKRQKHKKRIKKSASFILGEIAKIVGETINHFEEEGKVRDSETKEVAKFELTVLSFWLFKNSGVFNELLHKAILDEMHNQYYERLRKNGYNHEMRQLVCDDFNLHYRRYDEIYEDDEDLTIVSVEFSKFLSKKLKTEANLENAMLVAYLAKEIMPKFREWSEVVT